MRDYEAIAPDGAAKERTALAWGRSAISMVAIAASITKAGVEAGEDALGIASAGVLVLVAGVMLLIGEQLSHRRHATNGSLDPTTTRAALALLSIASVFTAVVALVIILAT